MNTGIQDAVNLGWKLAFARTGGPRGAARLLRRERRPVARRVLALTHLLFWAEASTGRRAGVPARPRAPRGAPRCRPCSAGAGWSPRGSGCLPARRRLPRQSAVGGGRPAPSRAPAPETGCRTGGHVGGRRCGCTRCWPGPGTPAAGPGRRPARVRRPLLHVQRAERAPVRAARRASGRARRLLHGRRRRRGPRGWLRRVGVAPRPCRGSSARP